MLNFGEPGCSQYLHKFIDLQVIKTIPFAPDIYI